MIKKKIGFEGERFVHVNLDELERIKYSSIMNNLYIHSIGFYPQANHHHVERESGAKEYILIYCVDGKGCVKIKDETFQLEANQLIIIPPYTPHTYYADKCEPWSIYWLHFYGHNADYFAKTLCYPISIPTDDSSRIENRLSLFEEIFYTLNSGDDNSHIHYANCCFIHFLATIRYINIYRRVAPNQAKSYGDKMVHRLVHYMTENIDKQLSCSDFAEYVGYSESYLYRCFYKEIGVAPSTYFQSLKMKKACSLLTETNLLIKHIALKLGYQDPFYFSKMFTKNIGVSPNNYRKEHSIIG